MISGGGIEDVGEVGGVRGELARFDQHGGDRVAVAADEFCCRVHDDVGAMFKGTTEIGRGKGAVYNQWDACFMSDICNSTYIEHITARIAYRLAIKGTRAWCEGTAIICGIRAVDKDGVDDPGMQRQSELCVSARLKTA